MKKIRCLTVFLLSIAILVPMGLSAAAVDGEAWNYDNSLLAFVRVSEERDFTTEDFPEINATKALVTGKAPLENGFVYRVLISFAEGESFDVAAAALAQNPMVTSVVRNYFAHDYDERSTVVTLNETELNIPLGGTAELYLSEVDLCGVQANNDLDGIVFTVDPRVIDESNISADMFSACGIMELEAATDTYGWRDGYYGLYEHDEFDYIPDVSHSYVGYTEDRDDKAHLEAIDAICGMEGIIAVWPCIVFTPTGNPNIEEWSVENETIASFTLSGGEREDIDLVNQTATVKGESVGTTTVTVRRSGFGAEGFATCRVNVYVPDNVSCGDVNVDGKVDSLDAAQVLRYDAGLTQLTGFVDFGDVNADGTTDSLDAASILKLDAGLITEF